MLLVPSVLAPNENTWLINPGHPDYGRIVVRDIFVQHLAGHSGKCSMLARHPKISRHYLQAMAVGHRMEPGGRRRA